MKIDPYQVDGSPLEAFEAKPEVEAATLTGELLVAYGEFRGACAGLELANAKLGEAQERYRQALGKFCALCTK